MRLPAGAKAGGIAVESQVLFPTVRAQEQAWCLLQLAALNEEDLLPYRELLPLRFPLAPGLRWAPWGGEHVEVLSSLVNGPGDGKHACRSVVARTRPL